MSAGDVEVVRRIYDAFAQHRFPEALLDAEFEWRTHPALPDAGTRRGRREVRAFFADWVAGWEDVRTEPREIVDAGDAVVVLIRGRFQLSASSPPFESDYAHVWTVEEGRATRCHAVDIERALALIGRRPQ